MFALIFGLLSNIPGMLGKYFEKKQELESIKLETQKQIALAQQAMSADMAKAEATTAMARLGATAPYFKYFTFCMWFGPFISGVFVPAFAEGIFNNLALMPAWYVQSCVMIMFAIWGIQVAAPVVAGIFQGLNHYLVDKRDYKLEKARIVNDKAFFERMRNGIFQKGMTEEQVKVMQDALAARESE